MASDSGDAGEERPPEGVDRALEIAVAHMQVLLSSIAGFDGKVMFLTALNVAGISALVGIAASTEPALWLFGFSLASSTICVLLGLGNLWTRDADQFPTPDEAMHIASTNKQGGDALAWRYLKAISRITQNANKVRSRKARLMRRLLIGTPISLGLVVATALTTAV